MHHWVTYPNVGFPVEVHFPFGWHVGSLTGIHFYGISYLIGFLCVYLWMARPAALRRLGLTRENVQDFIFYAVVGVIVGGRVLFVIADMLTPASQGGHSAASYFEHPLNFIAIWNGGMAFHGGMVGVIVAIYLFVRKHPGLTMTALADEVVMLAPIGITLTRLVNFVNDELWGTVCRPDRPWCIIPGASASLDDPATAGLYHHPAQLYEAVLDLATLPVLLLIYRMKPRNGVVGWSWFVLYGITRTIAEIWRAGGVPFLGLHGGQLLSVPMIVIGGIGMWYCATRGRRQSTLQAG